MSSRPIVCLALFAVALCAGPARADVIVVDFVGGPGSDYTFLWEAVDAAQDGDTLLIRSGIYNAWPTLDGRALSFIGDGPNVQWDGLVTVRNLAAHQKVVFRGITLGYGGAIELDDNEGVLYVEDCTILADQQGGPGQYAAIRAIDSRVVVTDSIILGSINYAIHGAPPTPGIEAIRSELVITNSAVYGGPGDDPYDVAVQGAAGMVLDDSLVRVQDSTIEGGYGASAMGGTGLVAANGSSLRLLQSSVSGGNGSPGGIVQTVDGSSQVMALSGAAHALPSVSPVREGESYVVTVQGAPGDAVWLGLSFGPGWFPTANDNFVLTLGAPFELVPLGALGPSGEVVISQPVPELGAGWDGFDVLVQDLYVEAGSGRKVFGPTTVITLLDGAL
jgi:hypothetical protein